MFKITVECNVNTGLMVLAIRFPYLVTHSAACAAGLPPRNFYTRMVLSMISTLAVTKHIGTSMKVHMLSFGYCVILAAFVLVTIDNHNMLSLK